MPKVVHFSDAATIGIHSLIILAREKSTLNAIQLSEKIGASKHHNGKVLQRLVKDGLLQSNRGPTGGFSIKKDPGEVNIDLGIFA
jgi:Rrf2 family protein